MVFEFKIMVHEILFRYLAEKSLETVILSLSFSKSKSHIVKID